MKTQGHRFLYKSRLPQYQGLLCKKPRVTLEIVRTLNPTTFHPIEEVEPDHDGSKVTDEAYTSHPDQGSTIKNPELTLFSSNSSSYLEEGAERALRSDHDN